MSTNALFLSESLNFPGLIRHVYGILKLMGIYDLINLAGFPHISFGGIVLVTTEQAPIMKFLSIVISWATEAKGTSFVSNVPLLCYCDKMENS